MALRILDVGDPERIRRHTDLMRRKQWDLENDFDWRSPIDVTRPLLPPRAVDRMFPGLDPDERLALAQILGIVVIQIFSDAERFLSKTRDELWPDFERQFAGHPALLELGTQFFDEERKHAEMFRRYVDLWLVARGLDPVRFHATRPRFSESWQHRVVLRNARRGGLAFWWLVLLAEEESPLIYEALEEDAGEIEPLYLSLHRKHFEEEARHATFAYTAMAYLADGMGASRAALHRRTDVILCQVLQWSFMAGAIAHQRREMQSAPPSPFLDSVRRGLEKVRGLPLRHLFRVFFREPTLVSPFLNYRFHPNMVEMANTRRLWTVPLPAVSPVPDSGRIGAH